MTSNSYLDSLKSAFPEILKSPDSPNTYALVAEKDGAKLGVSCQLDFGKVKYKEGTINGAGIVFRLIQTKGSSENLEFKMKGRGAARFEAANGAQVLAARGYKEFFPVTYFPISLQEFLASCVKQSVFEELLAFIKALVETSGATMLFSDDIVIEAMKAKFAAFDFEAPDLFESPNKPKAEKPKANKPEPKAEPDEDEDEDGEQD